MSIGVVATDAGCPMQHRRGVFKRVLEANEKNYQKILMSESERLMKKIAQKIENTDNSTFDISDDVSALSYNMVMRMIFNTELSQQDGMFNKFEASDLTELHSQAKTHIRDKVPESGLFKVARGEALEAIQLVENLIETIGWTLDYSALKIEDNNQKLVE